MKKKTILIIAISVILLIAIAVAIFFIMKNNKKFTISFDAQDGNEIAEIKIKKNETVVLPQEPTKEGYKFLYWVDEDGNAILSNFKAKKDKKLTAEWAEADKEIITVTFDTDGGSIIPEMKLVKGEKITLPEAPTKDGYDFKNWIDKDGNTFDIESQIEEDTTLKAIWEKKKEEKKQETQQQTEQPQQQQQPQQNNNKQENKNVEATGISLNKSSVELVIGNTGSLTATVTPADAINKTVTWSSSDSSVISVDSSGNLKANKIGEATITAKTANGKTATATVYSDVSSITLSATRTYITKYNGQTGAKSQTQLTVTTSPAVDASLIKWSAPDASGANAAAYFSGSGTSATITARDVWGSNNSSIPVTVSVGRKTSNKITIYVEPILNDLTSSVGTPVVVNRGVNVRISSNIPVEWSFNSSEFSTNVNKQSNYVTFTSKNERSYQQGFAITATTNAGQKKTISISVNAK